MFKMKHLLMLLVFLSGAMVETWAQNLSTTPIKLIYLANQSDEPLFVYLSMNYLAAGDDSYSKAFIGKQPLLVRKKDKQYFKTSELKKHTVYKFEVPGVKQNVGYLGIRVWDGHLPIYSKRYDAANLQGKQNVKFVFSKDKKVSLISTSANQQGQPLKIVGSE